MTTFAFRTDCDWSCKLISDQMTRQIWHSMFIFRPTGNRDCKVILWPVRWPRRLDYRMCAGHERVIKGTPPRGVVMVGAWGIFCPSFGQWSKLFGKMGLQLCSLLHAQWLREKAQHKTISAFLAFFRVLHGPEVEFATQMPHFSPVITGA